MSCDTRGWSQFRNETRNEWFKNRPRRSLVVFLLTTTNLASSLLITPSNHPPSSTSLLSIMLRNLVLPVAWIILSRTAARAQGTIDTPSSLVTCQPTLLHWENGVAPYYLTIIPGNEPTAAPLKTFGELDGTQITWLVDLGESRSFFSKVVRSFR